MYCFFFFFFFFQAEDGIRDRNVTGVQTCALPILLPGGASTDFLVAEHLDVPMDLNAVQQAGSRLGTGTMIVLDDRSEERRVGKEGRSRWAADDGKKKK